MYVNAEGFQLGKWLERQRTTKILPERKEKLDALGMRWEKKPDPWEVRYQLARTFYEQNGHLRVPTDYRPKGIWLGKWLNEQKQIYWGKRPGKSLTPQQIQRLEDIAITWSLDRRRNTSEGKRPEPQI